MAFWTTPNANDLVNSGRWDAEAFSPFLRALDSKFRKSPKVIELATVTHPAEIPRNYTNEKNSVVFLLAQNIRPLLPETSKEFRIAREIADSIPVNRLQHEDVLVTRSGANSGTCAVYLGKDGESYTSGEGLIVRSLGDIDGAYLAVFFNTSAGQALCRRAIYGSGQPHIGPKYLAQARVPRLGKIEVRASKLVRAAYDELKAAETLYPNAEVELLERLGWEEILRRPMELSYSVNFGELNIAMRADAEFFQPRFTRIRKQLCKRGAQTLASLVSHFDKGTQPDQYNDDGEVIVVKSKQVTGRGISLERCERTTGSVWKEVSARLHAGDMVINSTGRGTLGRAAVIPVHPGRTVAAVDLVIAHLRREIIYPEYAALFLNSPAGLAQSDQFQTGSSGQLHLYPQHFAQFLIYLPRQKNGIVDLAWQAKLVAKVEAAFAANVAARARLDEAKRLVEEAISRQCR